MRQELLRLLREALRDEMREVARERLGTLTVLRPVLLLAVVAWGVLPALQTMKLDAGPEPVHHEVPANLLAARDMWARHYAEDGCEQARWELARIDEQIGAYR